MNQLNIGDKIASKIRGNLIGVLTVVETNDDFAFACYSDSDHRYEIYRVFNNPERLSIVGGSTVGNSAKFSIASSEDIELVELLALRSKCQYINFSNFTADQCRRILEIANGQ